MGAGDHICKMPAQHLAETLFFLGLYTAKFQGNLNYTLAEYEY